MRHLNIDDLVRLERDIPELGVHCGDIGVVVSTWFAPSVAYEVDLHPDNLGFHIRVLVQPEHLNICARSQIPVNQAVGNSVPRPAFDKCP